MSDEEAANTLRGLFTEDPTIQRIVISGLDGNTKPWSAAATLMGYMSEYGNECKYVRENNEILNALQKHLCEQPYILRDLRWYGSYNTLYLFGHLDALVWSVIRQHPEMCCERLTSSVDIFVGKSTNDGLNTIIQHAITDKEARVGELLALIEACWKYIYDKKSTYKVLMEICKLTNLTENGLYDLGRALRAASWCWPEPMRPSARTADEMEQYKNDPHMREFVADYYKAEGKDLCYLRWQAVLTLNEAAVILGIPAERIMKDERGEVEYTDIEYMDRVNKYKKTYSEYKEAITESDGMRKVKDICDRITDYKKEKELSFFDLSEITGLPVECLQTYSTDTSQKIPLGDVIKLARAFDISVGCLIHKDEDEAEEENCAPNLINQRIALIRTEIGCPEGTIAAALGMDEYQYLTYETSKEQMPFLYIETISELLGVTTTVIIGGMPSRAFMPSLC